MRRRRSCERQWDIALQFSCNLGGHYVHKDNTIWVKKKTFLAQGSGQAKRLKRARTAEAELKLVRQELDELCEQAERPASPDADEMDGETGGKPAPKRADRLTDRCVPW